MYKMIIEQIAENCFSNAVFRRGSNYYKAGHVEDMIVDEDQGYAHALVLGSHAYDVDIHFKSNGEISNVYCDCPAYAKYPGYCKHIIAVLLKLENMYGKYLGRPVMDAPFVNGRDRFKVDKAQKNQKMARSLMSFFENRSVPVSKQPLNIEVTLEILSDYRGGSRGIIPALSLRMGVDRLYVVRDMKKMLYSLKRGESIEYGKNFTFNPTIQYFKEDDRPLIEFLYGLYDVDSLYPGDSIFNGKYIYLSDTSLEKFFKIWKDSPLYINMEDREGGSIEIIEDNISANFRVRQKDSHLLLDIDVPLEIVFLTSNGRYVYMDGAIYNLPETQRENLLPFYKAVQYTGNKTLKFPKEEGDRFASFVLPQIKKAGILEIDSSVEEMFYQRPLEASIYIDKMDNSITISLKFIYGDYEIDPFAKANSIDDENILIRDREKEGEILDIIERSAFKVNKDNVYLDDDDRIYDFITQYIPKLQQLCTVYYSESFRQMRIYDSSYYNSSISFDEELDLLEFNFSIDGIDRESLPKVFESLREKKKYYRLPNGSYIPLDSDELEDMWKMIEYLDLEEEDLSEQVIKLPKYRALYLDDKLKDVENIYVERNLAFKELVQNIKESRDIDYTLPKGLEDVLRGYQVTGFKWLKALSSYGLGGILADDMGLGKTLQTIAFIESERENIALPSFIICPTSLIYNWESEVEKFIPSLKTLVISGSKDERRELIEHIADVDIVITSYPLIRRDIDSYEDKEFGYCILDEAQNIKNPSSVTAKSVKKVKAKGYFALTGTPIENNLTELWSIFDFIMPGYLLSHGKFVKRFEKPIIQDRDQCVLEELNRYIRPFILRRLKTDVLKELPPKIENIRTVELTHSQKKVYLAYLQNIRGELAEDIRQNGIKKSQIQILAGLTRLRQICCHPSLFIENYNGDSGKIKALLEILGELKEGGHRVLLFSQFTGALGLIKEELDREGISYFYLDGSTKAEDRRDMVKAFNQGFRDIFLISLKAGGTGFNLTGADTVIHFDPWWNPAVEDQATERAYRMGKQNKVQVRTLIAKGTGEEKIHEIQQNKRELIDKVLEPGTTFISKMTEEDIMELFM